MFNTLTTFSANMFENPEFDMLLVSLNVVRKGLTNKDYRQLSKVSAFLVRLITFILPVLVV
jgi:hypothetical protein